MGFCSLLPVVGATLVWVPTTIGLLLSGAIGRGIGLLVLGVFGISMADNVLRTLVLTGKTSVSGLVIFFGLARWCGRVRIHRPGDRPYHPRHHVGALHDPAPSGSRRRIRVGHRSDGDRRALTLSR